MIVNKDSLEYLKQFNDYEFDINYSDPPYALGSEVIIRPDGKVDYKKANDFMNKWEMPTGTYWEQWFKESYRTLKHGGYLIMFGMDRQLLLFKYYANLAGFTEQQSLYWYFISNFPKATDLSKQIDKNAGAERNIIEVKGNKNNEVLGITKGVMADNNAITELAKKYNGYKYSIAPLKQTNETIMVFFKPTKTGSVLHDVLAKESGDETISGNCIDIDGNRVGTESRVNQFAGNKNGYTLGDDRNEKGSGFWKQDNQGETETTGRYPSQTFCDSNIAEILGEPSKILHKCDFEENEHDLYFYNPKVSKSERNAGCDELDEKEQNITNMYDMERDNGTIREQPLPRKNNHCTLKPIKLNERILKLFKTPNEQKIIYPFAGSGSEIIGGIKAGFTNWVGCEINPDYVEIAKARIDYWSNKFDYGLDEIVVEKKIDESQVSLFDLMEEEK